MFQHTAARRRLQRFKMSSGPLRSVSTHSRPKAAAKGHRCQPIFGNFVSTHSRPKAAAYQWQHEPCLYGWFQHTAARRRLHTKTSFYFDLVRFQHTAARRRLHFDFFSSGVILKVSTHSRPKAAALVQRLRSILSL